MDRRFDRIEYAQQHDSKAMLDIIDQKVSRTRVDVDYLSEKTGVHDVKLNNLAKRLDE
ncbi:hypothetical protein [Pontibacillus salipaludis]|uniref:Uncharacterized protein n=1 Tax=Pontibacillus salipaludis TaxID=1697394 RepID=A0ABQ1Q512_9BACI|nr:hypothetical protein [Pontibacillus salipaludis]GGD13993.1 hypothetical protein GCM10011389_22070 [Pontibacillus salipaludis]